MGVDPDARWHDTPGSTLVSRRHASEVSGGGRRVSQRRTWRDTLRRRRRRHRVGHWSSLPRFLMFVVLWLVVVVSPVDAVLVDFQNCLSQSVIQSSPLQLQFIPLDVSVSFDPQSPLHLLNVTVYGNVSGTADRRSTYPLPDDPQWINPNETVGKITDLDTSNNKFSTLLTSVDVVSFSPYRDASRFCDSVHGDCPLVPAFYANASDLASLRSFSVQHDMSSAYHFSTLAASFTIKSGNEAATKLGCVKVDITPDLGSSLRSALAYVPLVILILVGVATITAAIYSPWGTTNPFHWTSNYGRDEDVLRLVTPGFGDCLQYIQFTVLTGALSLDYPGYYQPAVSQAAWSSLLFNQTFMNQGQERNPVVDGVYAVNETYGLDRLEHYVGMPSARDMWPGMIVWLLVIVVAVTLLIQVAFGFRWLHRALADVPEEDLRAKNWPFTIGNVIRIVFNYLFLPMVSISFFQLVIAGRSPAYSVVFAVILILIAVAFCLWTVRLIVTTRPKSYLYDDLSTVLLYGPLYNTFCDDAAAFAAVPLFVTFARGVAIGALQPSGIAQIVLLAICEVVSLLTLMAFKPFPSPTSMNLYHACFSIVRFLTILLSVVFVPSLQVSQSARGWIGYIILLLHGLVLVFGFFLNALQTLIEVVARLAGAGGYEGGVTRGGLVKVFGMRQLSRRVPRRDVGTRQSMGSEAAMLAHTDDRLSSQFDGSRPRSLSGSSALLLNRAGASDGRASAFFDTGSAHGGLHSRANSSGFYTPTPGAGYQTAGSNSPKSGPVFMQPHDPYYRPPRPRRRVTESRPSTERGRSYSESASRGAPYGDGEDDIVEATRSGRNTPVPAYIPTPKDDLDFEEPRRSRKDYAVREVDFYYRVRGPPLSQTGTRKLKTGPADPTGPVSSATGFFRGLFQGKTKEKGKGFEVVRSARAPPPGLMADGEEFHEPYRDEPDEPGAGGRPLPSGGLPAEHGSDGPGASRSAEAALTLPPVDTGDDIELPRRASSRHSTASGGTETRRSRRADSISSLGEEDLSQRSLPVVTEAVSAEAHESGPYGGSNLPPGYLHHSSSVTGRLPFSATSSPSRDRNMSIASTTGSASSGRQQGRPSSMGYVAQHRTRDNIHERSGDEPTFTGSAAELVDDLHHDSR